MVIEKILSRVSCEKGFKLRENTRCREIAANISVHITSRRIVLNIIQKWSNYPNINGEWVANIDELLIQDP